MGKKILNQQIVIILFLIQIQKIKATFFSQHKFNWFKSQYVYLNLAVVGHSSKGDNEILVNLPKKWSAKSCSIIAVQ